MRQAEADAEAQEKPGRLIVISNRIPTDEVPAGGLVYAIHEALNDIGGLWIGAGTPSDEAQEGLTEVKSEAYDKATFSLSRTEYDRYYLGYSNSVLWPLFHHRADLLSVYERDFEAYREVNRRVARAVAEIARPDDMIWIQDYHFLMLAREMRDLGLKNRIGLFLHIPFPNASDILALPQGPQIANWLAAHDLVGLQTQRDVAAARETLRRDPDCEAMGNGNWLFRGREFAVLSFPIGIDAEEFARKAAESPVPELQLSPDAPLLLGVDRLDYSKGLVHRFRGFGAYLEQRSQHGTRPTFLQIAPVSREDVSAYQDIREELERAAGSINGAYADLDWTPIRYVRRHVARERLAALFRRANVALVTPLADGMNLVAKEFVAAQNPDDPGVLILSHFAGAAEQMQAALMVNPFDHGNFAHAIDRALHMSLAERQDRHASLRENVFKQDIAWWTRTYLNRLSRVPAYQEDRPRD
ncbi:Alpha,alpha-trehalose-phosphate synthase [UDP-forming] [Jannaschia seosinensis]|uniref:Alpha,alpha-trehalose-phosphate synthase [UDP-forming] n=1 Tax=Jannaschia seosinensis TaxID=313367 RepID=A0A0M7B4G5_9RHOB|nr:trehalose-6-phosphate synthase [Jannaschia seosinensis]CUH13025.1 Alpha,alpha-trehalose-phosphate synthase [UDP-forming] [Jannaschia seosinensis]